MYWIVSVFMFLWGAAYAGLVVFSFGIATPEHWRKLVEEGRITHGYADYIAAIPHWVVILTFIAAITRFAGGVGLLMQKNWAFPMYAASLVVVFTLMFRGFVIADVASVIRTSQLWLEIVFLGLSFFAVWWSQHYVVIGLLR